jgi:hypothetical protein
LERVSNYERQIFRDKVSLDFDEPAGASPPS